MESFRHYFQLRCHTHKYSSVSLRRTEFSLLSAWGILYKKGKKFRRCIAKKRTKDDAIVYLSPSGTFRAARASQLKPLFPQRDYCLKCKEPVLLYMYLVGIYAPMLQGFFFKNPKQTHFLKGPPKNKGRAGKKG